MSIKLEAVFFSDSEGDLAATVTLYKNQNGHTQQEMDIAASIELHIRKMFNQSETIPLKTENTNVH